MISRKGSLDKVVGSFRQSSKRVRMINMRRKSTKVFNLNPGAVEPRKFIPETGTGPATALMKDPNSKGEFNPNVIRKLQA